MTTTATHGETDAAHRNTVRIPTASGDEIEAWVYRPEGDGPHPAVVLAHGFAAVKAGGLASQRSRSTTATGEVRRANLGT